jgi:hypothetical protein
MALKRLDEEFELKPGTQLLPYMKRLLPSLEGRFQDLEATQTFLAGINEEIRAAALLRMNEILIPATKDILEVTQLGFLLAPIDGLFELVLGSMTFTIEEGVQRDTFTPSPYLIIEHTPDDYAIARTESYDQELGILWVTITALHGNPGPFDDWMVSSTPGMADSTKLYHDAIAPMHAEILIDYQDILIKHAEIVQAANDLVSAGLDLYAYVRRDGTSPFEAVQRGVSPVIGSNDNALATTAWTRSRMNEYLMGSMSSAGAAMTGPLYLYGPPSQPLMAATKAYVDSIIGSGGVVNNIMTITTANASLRLRSTGTGQHRMIEALSVDGAQRWVLSIADNAAESGANAGSNFSLLRYADNGTYIDVPLNVNRATGAMTVKALNYNGVLNGVGDANITGYIGATNYVASGLGGAAGTYYFGNTASKTLTYDGTDFAFAGGALRAMVKPPSGWSSNWNTAFQNAAPGAFTFGGDVSAGANAPNTGWWLQANMRHSNASSYWGMQIAYGWEDNPNEIYHRNWSGGTPSGWVRVLNTNNWSAYAQARDPQLFAGLPPVHYPSDTWTSASDAQKMLCNTGGAQTFTINGGLYPVGTAISFFAYANYAVIANTETMMWRAPSGPTTGNRTLGQYGFATAVKWTGGNWVISGNGLT